MKLSRLTVSLCFVAISGAANAQQCDTVIILNHLLRPFCNLPAASGEGAHRHGEQSVQRLAHGRRLARQINSVNLDLNRRVAVGRRGDLARGRSRTLPLLLGVNVKPPTESVRALALIDLAE